MIYLVLGLVAVIVVSVVVQRTRGVGTAKEQEQLAAADTAAPDEKQAPHPDGSAAPPSPPSPPSPSPAPAKAEELKPTLAAAPITTPGDLTGATYASLPASEASPYALGANEEKEKHNPSLLRWCGKNGKITVAGMTISGAVTYWSESVSTISEPSCIDLSLPVEFPGSSSSSDAQVGAEGQSESAAEQGEGQSQSGSDSKENSSDKGPDDPATLSYLNLTPAQRGEYLLWLAGGRISPPSHARYPLLWLFGIERRLLVDRLDTAMCVGELFRLLPLLRWETLRRSVISFATWAAAKNWLPEESLLAFGRPLPALPREILTLLLRPYADARLPLPSIIAFTLMRSNPFGDDRLPPSANQDEALERFSLLYKSKCAGGTILAVPKTSIFVAYAPSNPSIAKDKGASGGIAELPDFFKDTRDFDTLVEVWKDFLVEPDEVAKIVEDKPDLVLFFEQLTGAEDGQKAEASVYAVTTLGELAEVIRAEVNEFGVLNAASRRRIDETARVEGFLVVPSLGVAGKEYRVENKAALCPFPAGSVPSREYRTAAFALEYAMAIDAEAAFERRGGIEAYFAPNFTAEDNAKLDALADVVRGGPESLENLGDCVKFWLGRGQRGIMRDFLSDFLGFPIPLASSDKRVLAMLESLDVAFNEPKRVEFGAASELGPMMCSALDPLFSER
ncbi:MAG: TerB N-terminal domain-containing protein [Synergistaceae bacterium]|nr:TerB N-terminal domain-containing protein [Synergistaceae bacterium]